MQLGEVGCPWNRASARPDREVHVDFRRPQVGTTSNETKLKNVATSVRSDNAGGPPETRASEESHISMQG